MAVKEVGKELIDAVREMLVVGKFKHEWPIGMRIFAAGVVAVRAYDSRSRVFYDPREWKERETAKSLSRAGWWERDPLGEQEKAVPVDTPECKELAADPGSPLPATYSALMKVCQQRLEPKGHDQWLATPLFATLQRDP
ncbi:MAG: hypothetical protein ABIA47_00415 [bacterium]